MDEKNSQQPTSEEDDPSGLATDGGNEVDYAEEEDRSRPPDSNQTDHYKWGLPWPQFVTIIVTVTIGFSAVVSTNMATLLRWYADTAARVHVQQRARPRFVLSIVKKREPNLSFSLTLKNVGETTALDPYGAWLQGECQDSSPQVCAEWCLRPLLEAKMESYEPVLSQGALPPQTFYPMKPPRMARKNRPPFYFCGYVTYTDISCVQRRHTQCLYYEPTTEHLDYCLVGNEEVRRQLDVCP